MSDIKLLDNIRNLVENEWLYYYNGVHKITVRDIEEHYIIFDYCFITVRYTWYTESDWADITILDARDISVEEMMSITAELWRYMATSMIHSYSNLL